MVFFFLLPSPFFLPSGTVSASEGPSVMTKEGYVKLLVQKNKTSPLVPPNADSLSTKDLYAAVQKLMAEKNIHCLDGTKGEDPLTREEYINLTYAFLTGEAGESIIHNKFFLKDKGVIDKNDIGSDPEL